MDTRYYHIQVASQTKDGPLPPVIVVRADCIKKISALVHECKVEDLVVARINGKILAWWIVDRED